MQFKHMTSLFALSLLIAPDSVFAGKVKGSGNAEDEGGSQSGTATRGAPVGEGILYTNFTAWEWIVGVSSRRLEEVNADKRHEYVTQMARYAGAAQREVDENKAKIAAKLRQLQTEDMSNGDNAAYDQIKASAVRKEVAVNKEFDEAVAVAEEAHRDAMEYAKATHEKATQEAGATRKVTLAVAPQAAKQIDVTESLYGAAPTVKRNEAKLQELHQAKIEADAQAERVLLVEKADAHRVYLTELADAQKSHAIAIAEAKKKRDLADIKVTETARLTALIRTLEGDSQAALERKAIHDAMVKYYSEQLIIADDHRKKLQAASESGGAAEGDGDSTSSFVLEETPPHTPTATIFMNSKAGGGSSWSWWSNEQHAAETLARIQESPAPYFDHDGHEAQVANFVKQHGLEALAEYTRDEATGLWTWFALNGNGKAFADTEVTQDAFNGLIVSRYDFLIAKGVTKAAEIDNETVRLMLRLAEAVTAREDGSTDESTLALAGNTAADRVKVWKLVSYKK